MSHNSLLTRASPAEVWAVLADGWHYAGWVVGASRVRAVDAHWPAEGSRLHHSFGMWPAVIDDNTEVLASVADVRLDLRARGWPAGEADVSIRLRASGAGTEIVIEEDAASGPGRLVPKPARDLMLHSRNAETLRRLAYLAERRTDPTPTPAPTR